MSTVRVAVGRAVARWLTSESRQSVSRAVRAQVRRARNRVPTILYFHEFGDPYSELAATQLARLRDTYAVHIECHAVPPPDAAAAPQANALREWSQRDAQQLAEHYGLQPTRESSALPAHLDTPARRESGGALRRRLGHYLGATFYFEGEWYWGVDRLHYLESRLIDSGLQRSPDASASTGVLWPPSLKFVTPATTPRHSTSRPTLEFFCSLRSPYTFLAVDRVRRLAQHYGATLELKFVLPMVMRGLPIPAAKRFYILADAKREAIRHGLPFGDVADPVGRPTERGLAVLHRAIELGCGETFLESFLRGAFAEGVDAGRDGGLLRLASRAGLAPSEVRDALANPSWREVAERRRNELLASGLWGVPTFRVNGLPAQWGQDRLWAVEDALIRAIS